MLYGLNNLGSGCVKSVVTYCYHFKYKYMIDTIRFQISISEECYKELKKVSIEAVQKNHVTGAYSVRFIKPQISVGSYSRHLNFFLDIDICSLEFSVPKQLYGNNIYLLPIEKVFSVIEEVYKAILKCSPCFPHYLKWEIYRVDLCYAWKFPSQELAKKVLNDVIHFLKPTRGNSLPYHYKDSIMFKSSTYTQKFYLKYPEFMKHDFKAISQVNNSEAVELSLLAEGVLRYEITIRKRALDYLFGKELNLTRLLDQDIMQVHTRYLNKFMSGTDQPTIKQDQIFYKLQEKWGKKKAIRLYQFYFSYFLNGKLSRDLIVENYDRTTIFRNLKDIKLANVGIVSDEYFNLIIPSPLSNPLFK